MRTQLRVAITLFMLISAVAGQQAKPPQGTLVGSRWRVTFSITGDAKKNLIFEPKAKGVGSFSLLDTGVDDKPVPSAIPAAWSELTNNRVSFSSEVELPLGSCCRELGTLMFKGRFESNDSIKGKIVFVTSVDEEESPFKFRSAVGTFTATRIK